MTQIKTSNSDKTQKLKFRKFFNSKRVIMQYIWYEQPDTSTTNDMYSGQRFAISKCFFYNTLTLNISYLIQPLSHVHFLWVFHWRYPPWILKQCKWRLLNETIILKLFKCNYGIFWRCKFYKICNGIFSSFSVHFLYIYYWFFCVFLGKFL